MQVCSAVWKDCNAIWARVKCPSICSLPHLQYKRCPPVVPLNYPMTLMGLSDVFWFWKLWSCESCSLRSRKRAEFWSTPRRSVFPLISPRPICEGRRLARSCALATSRDWRAAQPCGEEEIRLQILRRVQDTIIYDIIAGLLKLQINIQLRCVGKPPEHLQPACCTSNALVASAASSAEFCTFGTLFFSHWKSPTTHHWLQMLQDDTVAQ